MKMVLAGEDLKEVPRIMLTRSIFLVAVIASLILSAPSALASDGTRNLFNSDWRFIQGDPSEAHARDFDDSAWQAVGLPHDWAIEGPFDRRNNARTGGLPIVGKGWYRKSFDVPLSANGMVTTLEFDGAMEHSKVWVNGHFVGHRPNGYIGFEYDISEYVEPGETNVVAVRLEVLDLSTRWYSGAGLYRDVWIEYDNPVHINDSRTVVATPSIKKGRAVVAVKVGIDGRPAKGTVLEVVISDADGSEVSRKSVPVSSKKLDGTLATELLVKSARRWSIDDPYLYQIGFELRAADKTLDTYQLPLGIRSIKFSATEGFLLNGKHVPIRGVCLHHDNGPLGAVANRRAIERKLQIMKSMGANAIRTTHNMPSPHLVELADKLGLLVQVESFDVWKKAKNGAGNGYNISWDEWHERDLTDMVHQFRNYPSVFMWSTGNEILEQTTPAGKEIAKQLTAIVKRHDTSRPVTAGLSKHPDPFDNGMADELDVVGINYQPVYFDEIKARNPEWVLLSTESASTVSSRGVYHWPIEIYKKHPSWRISSYDVISPPNGYPAEFEWIYLRDNRSVIGEFIWTGFDYLGEPTPYSGRDHATSGYWNKDWPARSSYFGAVDLAGLPKDRYYLYQSEWTDKPMVHLLPHWNWEGREGEAVPVMAYTNGDEVELFLNGESLGRKKKGVDTVKISIERFRHRAEGQESFESPYRLRWDVPYTPGTLRAVSYKNGKAFADTEVITSGVPHKVRLVPDRDIISADGQDLSYVTVQIEDKEGNPVPYAENMVRFIVKGEGYIAGVGNGDAATVEPFKADYRRTFSGKAVAIIQSNGKAGQISVQAVSDRLVSDEIGIKSIVVE